MKKRTKILLAVFIAFFAGFAVAIGVYANDYYKAVGVNAFLKTKNEAVSVSKIKEGYLFDGPGTDNALIFYPGAKVEETAYAPLMHSLAKKGVDCFLIKMPLRLAFFGMNRASRIVNAYDYEHFYLAGHSLGGAMAADYAAKHSSEFDALFLLAAYPSKDLTAASFPVIFIYGENDTVLNREKLQAGFCLVPPNYKEVKIAGGNHTLGASYGAQKGDGKATISAQKQLEITAQTILKEITH